MMKLSKMIGKTVREDIESAIGQAVVSSVKTIVSRQGKYSGQLRASNNVGLGAPDLSKVEVANYAHNAISGTKSLAISNAENTVKGVKLGKDIYISNNHEYALYDEVRPGRLAYTGAGNMLQAALSRSIAAQ